MFKKQTSGLIFSTWVDYLDDLLSLCETKEDFENFTLTYSATLNATIGRVEESKQIMLKVNPKSPVYMFWKNTIMPNALENLEKRKIAQNNGKGGGCPLNYEKTIQDVLRNCDKHWHVNELVDTLNKWFLYLKSNGKRTNKEIVEAQVEDIVRLTNGAEHAITIITQNMQANNSEIDYDIIYDDDGLLDDE